MSFKIWWLWTCRQVNNFFEPPSQTSIKLKVTVRLELGKILKCLPSMHQTSQWAAFPGWPDWGALQLTQAWLRPSQHQLQGLWGRGSCRQPCLQAALVLMTCTERPVQQRLCWLQQRNMACCLCVMWKTCGRSLPETLSQIVEWSLPTQAMKKPKKSLHLIKSAWMTVTSDVQA